MNNIKFEIIDKPGYKVVPVEPTRYMLDECHRDLDRTGEIDPMLKHIWSQMLSAAPSIPSELKPVGEVVAATGSLNDLAVIQWISDYRPKIGDNLYGPEADAIIAAKEAEIEEAKKIINALDAAGANYSREVLQLRAEVERLTRELGELDSADEERMGRETALQEQLAAAQKDAPVVGKLLCQWKSGKITGDELADKLFGVFASSPAIDSAMQRKEGE